nr:hypothetical protein [uncultured Rhodopila sp.]
MIFPLFPSALRTENAALRTYIAELEGRLEDAKAEIDAADDYAEWCEDRLREAMEPRAVWRRRAKRRALR